MFAYVAWLCLSLTTWGQGQSNTTELDPEQVARAVENYLAANPPAREEKGWERVLDRLSMFGDLRLRHESNFSRTGLPDRRRERLRLRIGGNYGLSDELSVGARLVTGEAGDPNSSHVTLGDGFDSIDLNLDRAFATWRPKSAPGLWLTGGKFAHAFHLNPVYGELLWDGDVQPEGLFAGYRLEEVGPLKRLTLRAGEYLLLEQGNASNASAFVIQLDGELPISESWSSHAAIGYYHYTDVTPDGAISLLGDNAGNATVDLDADLIPDRFESDFQVLNPLLSFDYSGFHAPLVLSAEYIENLGAKNSRDTGWALGAAMGGARESGDTRLYYQWQTVEQDAVFSPFAQDDFLFTTNHRSHLLGCNYQLTDKIGLNLWGLVSRIEDAAGALNDDDQWRVRLDLNVKF